MSNSTTSLDLPPALAALLTGPSQTPAMPMGGIATAGMQQGSGAPQALPSYQVGGMVGPGGMPIRAGAGGQPGLAAPGSMGQSLPPEQIQAEVQRFVQQHPQQVQQMQMEIQKLIQSGQVSMEELNMVVQMAQAAAQNPALYPQLRQIAIQRGIADEESVSPQFDSGLIFVLALIGAVMQSGGMQPKPVPSFKKGGMLHGNEDGDSEAVVAQLHEGEFVIPAHIVRAKGTEFFDKMLESYSEDNSESDD
jgi:hypothetical protein